MHTHEAGFIRTDCIIGLAVKTHCVLRLGLLEAVYHHCFCRQQQHASTIP
jgi:hypothetical protein